MAKKSVANSHTYISTYGQSDSQRSFTPKKFIDSLNNTDLVLFSGNDTLIASHRCEKNYKGNI